MNQESEGGVNEGSGFEVEVDKKQDTGEGSGILCSHTWIHFRSWDELIPSGMAKTWCTQTPPAHNEFYFTHISFRGSDDILMCGSEVMSCLKLLEFLNVFGKHGELHHGVAKDNRTRHIQNKHPARLINSTYESNMCQVPLNCNI
jgi:hypothetical protein